MTTHLVWFRNDLRLTDNRALHAACADAGARVIALFIATPRQWEAHGMAARQAAFLRQNLLCLQQALAQRGIPLHVGRCDDFRQGNAWLSDVCCREQVTQVFYNRQYELNERRRDDALAALLPGVTLNAFDDSLLIPPGRVVTGDGGMYKVYTPFRRAFLQRLSQEDTRSLPAPAARAQPVACAPLPDWDIAMTAPDPAQFPAGEEAAIQRLRAFCREQAQDYGRLRDIPAVAGTSQLSPYLALGVLSPRQCLNRLRLTCPEVTERPEGGAFTWLNELIWREFYRHLMAACPDLCRHRPFLAWTDGVAWRAPDDAFDAWCEGRTGYPIVDAAMRQLNATGWMHNRLRMISASFLVKDLLVDWRHGERYFMSRLIDGDLAANNGGWQWAASTGTDSVPYFRIFNPVTQGKRFDPHGHFIRRWLPELAALPDAEIHQPWRSGLAPDYPPPQVDHARARLETLAAYEQARKDYRPK